MLGATERCHDHHACFRVLLQAMSRPGSIFTLPDNGDRKFDTLVLRLLDTLLDQQTSCHLVDDDPVFATRLRERTGTQFGPVDQADFLLAFTGDSRGMVKRARRGRSDYPDEGATVLYGVERLEEGTADSGLRLSGPGIPTAIFPRIEGLAGQELTSLRAINVDYPLGIDSMFVDRRGKLMCIPRSTRIGGD